ncbi:hypothetical protein JCM10213_008324 [Rhodosporidiobolus nylandii]
MPDAPAAIADAETLNLLVEVLEEELRDAQSRQLAERMEVEETANTATGGRAQQSQAQVDDSDEVLALRRQLDDLKASISRAAVEGTAREDGDCRPVSDPYTAALKVSSSGALPFGIYFGERKEKHVACLSCAAEYVQQKLEDPAVKAFPIHCHEAECTYALTDTDAARIFGEANLERWHYRKLLDSQVPLFCPNPRCSERLARQPDAEQNPQAACPACQTSLCAMCGTRWHQGYTCEQYQSLPEDARNPEDLSLLTLARANRWSRCPGCSVVIEHNHGCAHMTCSLCRTESCYICGSLWERIAGNRNGRCPRGCPLWAREEDLLRPEFRNAALLVPAAAAAAAAAFAAPPLPVFRAPLLYADDEIDEEEEYDAEYEEEMARREEEQRLYEEELEEERARLRWEEEEDERRYYDELEAEREAEAAELEEQNRLAEEEEYDRVYGQEEAEAAEEEDRYYAELEAEAAEEERRYLQEVEEEAAEEERRYYAVMEDDYDAQDASHDNLPPSDYCPPPVNVYDLPADAADSPSPAAYTPSPPPQPYEDHIYEDPHDLDPPASEEQPYFADDAYPQQDWADEASAPYAVVEVADQDWAEEQSGYAEQHEDPPQYEVDEDGGNGDGGYEETAQAEEAGGEDWGGDDGGYEDGGYDDGGYDDGGYDEGGYDDGGYDDGGYDDGGYDDGEW